MRRSITAIAVLAVIAVPASAHSAPTLRAIYKHQYRKVERHFGKGAAGRDIAADGVAGRRGDRPARDAELARSIRTMRTMLAPPAPAAVVTSATASPTGGTTPQAGLQGSGCGSSCQQCESNGNPQAVDPSGTYWSAYQFDRQTWEANGGSPSSYGSAPKSEQDRVAGNINYDAWPNC